MIDTQTKRIVHQTFNFIDVLGGKQMITADNIERFMAIRGVFEPQARDLELITRSKRESEVHNFVTKVTECAGEEFTLPVDRLEMLN